MIKAIDHVIVAVSDLRVAEKDYIQLLGSEPVWKALTQTWNLKCAF